ncbi:MAG: PIN domain-containing protein [Defluviitaleaceae bacterium]|nr:PIN domain-containing protein [Defluviitaleaceae bacterium]
MKNMALLIDTNVMLDWMLEREPFVKQAGHILRLCIDGKVTGYLASHTILNAFYISRKEKSIEERKRFLLMLCKKFKIIGINEQMLIEALQNDAWQDLEDGLQMQCAISAKLDYIITRDLKGFTNSLVKALSPQEFLEKAREAVIE